MARHQPHKEGTEKKDRERLERKAGKKDNSLVFQAYRPLSNWLSKILINTPITGDHISLFLLPFTALGFYLLALGMLVPASIILQMSLLLDCMDGALARLKSQKINLSGYYYEAIWHEMLFPFFYLSLGWYSSKILGSINYFFMGIFVMATIFIVNALLHRKVMVYELKDYYNKEAGYTGSQPTLFQRVIRFIVCPSYVFTYIILLSLLGVLEHMIVAYAWFYAVVLGYNAAKHIFGKKPA